tara:strand:+ start:1529 stop:3985 length:2457 start_codon:yes stop_codon:yes gene_type:complete
MAEIKEPNLDWFNALPQMEQEFLHKQFPTDEEKSIWRDQMGMATVSPGLMPRNWRLGLKGKSLDPWGVMPDTDLVPETMSNFLTTGDFGVLGHRTFERTMPLETFRKDPNAANYAGVLELPYYMKTLIPYIIGGPVGIGAAAWDVIEGLKRHDPLQVSVSALGVGGIAKSLKTFLALGGITLVPTEAEAGIFSRALNYIKRLPTVARGEELNTTANTMLKNLEDRIQNEGGLKGVEFRAIREHLDALGYNMNKVQPITKIIDDLEVNNYFDDMDVELIDGRFGTMSVTKVNPNSKNMYNKQISKVTNPDAQVHFPVGHRDGILSHTKYEIRDDTLYPLEFQSDMASSIRSTGFRGTPENDLYIEKTQALFKAMTRNRSWDEFPDIPPGEAFSFHLGKNKLPREVFDAIIDHPNFPTKMWEDWRKANPDMWKKMNAGVNGDILVPFFKSDGSPINWGGFKDGNANPFYIFQERMQKLDPLIEIAPTRNMSYEFNPQALQPDIGVREAPYHHPLLNRENWLQWEVSNIVEMAVNNPNIKRIKFPTAREVLETYGDNISASDKAYITRIYEKELPKKLKNLDLKFSEAPETIGKTATNDIRVMFSGIPVAEEKFLMELYGRHTRILDQPMSSFMNKYYHPYTSNPLVHPSAVDPGGYTVDKQLDALLANIIGEKVGAAYVDEIETIATEIIRKFPEQESSINLWIKTLRKADKQASKEMGFASGSVGIDDSEIGKLEYARSLAASDANSNLKLDRIGKTLNTYNEIHGFALDDAIKNLSKSETDNLIDAGILKRMKGEEGIYLEITPELIDKVQGTGLPGI